jgi:glucitol operon activator protein
LDHWSYLLGAFGVLWFIQIVGTALQMRHYRRVLTEITGTWQDGFVGVGNARAKLGKGVILILVASPDGSIRQALAMRGRTVFASFKPVPELQHKNLRDLRMGNVPATLSQGGRQALERAISQIDQAAQRRATPPTSDIELGAPAPSLG